MADNATHNVNDNAIANVEAELSQAERDKARHQQAKDNTLILIAGWENEEQNLAHALLSMVARRHWRDATKLEGKAGKKDRRTFAEVVNQHINRVSFGNSFILDVIKEARDTAAILHRTLTKAEELGEVPLLRALCVSLGVERKRKDDSKVDIRELCQRLTGETVTSAYVSAIVNVAKYSDDVSMSQLDKLREQLEELQGIEAWEKLESKMVTILEIVRDCIAYPAGVQLHLEDGRILTPVHVALETLGIRESGRQYREAIRRASATLAK